MRSANMTNNCDANKYSWLYDEGVLNVKKYLPVVRMDFSQENNKEHTLARMSLGALRCNGIIGYTGGYILTFLNSNAILKLKPWKRGTLSLCFRTARNNSVIFHQLRSKTNTNNLMAKVYDDHTMEFSYRQNGRKGVVHLKTTRQLTDRDWHLITIEQTLNTVRFSVDMENEVVMLKEGEKVKAYDGPFLLGGSLSTEVMDDPNVQGVVGCIAGLIINNRVKYLADIYTIQQSVVREGMAVGCSTLCHENTCKYGGRCIERFTSYKCVCLDRATSGEHCEISEITFILYSLSHLC
ncbi:neurexin-4-like [Anneissia japonica]|uniref:neurexin-4-like n=1 Tax=Anneissia japonica TaxID=1529436 RepID=UPI0014257066|nr:neurexin-4-like [Anneissia japonica]